MINFVLGSRFSRVGGVREWFQDDSTFKHLRQANFLPYVLQTIKPTTPAFTKQSNHSDKVTICQSLRNNHQFCVLNQSSSSSSSPRVPLPAAPPPVFLAALPVISCQVAPNLRPVLARRPSSSSSSASSSAWNSSSLGVRKRAVTKTMR